MSGALRALGWLVILAGATVGGVAAGAFAGDAGFAEVAAAYARHREHPLFQIDYYKAALWHYGMLLTAVLSIAGGVTAGALLIGVGTLLARLPPRDAHPE